MGKHLLKTVMAVTLIGAAAYCLKRFSDELVVYVSPDDAPRQLSRLPNAQAAIALNAAMR